MHDKEDPDLGIPTTVVGFSFEGDDDSARALAMTDSRMVILRCMAEELDSTM